MSTGIDIYLDGADLHLITRWAKHPAVSGFTTNPSLLAAAGVTDYAEFGKLATAAALDKPISFEVVTDDLRDMERQALRIAAWGRNVFVKIPITNAVGTSTLPLVTRLTESGVNVNVTAVFTDRQIEQSLWALIHARHAIISIFAGRIGDTGREPETWFANAQRMRQNPNVKLLWASTREVYNILQAARIGVDIITISPTLLDKAGQYWDKDLEQYSLETVTQFLVDAQRSGLVL